MTQARPITASPGTVAEASRKDAFFFFLTFPGAAPSTLTLFSFKTARSVSAIFIPRLDAEMEVPSSTRTEHSHVHTVAPCWATGGLPLLVGSRGRKDSLEQNQGPEGPILALRGRHPQRLI